jgi:hypothetical protein
MPVGLGATRGHEFLRRTWQLYWTADAHLAKLLMRASEKVWRTSETLGAIVRGSFAEFPASTRCPPCERLLLAGVLTRILCGA